MSKKIIMIGAGGHASVLAETLYGLNKTIHAVISPDIPRNSALFAQAIHLKTDAEIRDFSPDDYILVNGIGAMPGSKLRANIATKFRALGFKFMSVIAASALVSPNSSLGEGVQILTRAIVQPGCVIGDDVIINSGVIVEHDCHIGASSHLAPGAVLSGGVNMGNSVHVGTNATVIQNITIAAGCIVGAGVIINKNLESAAIVYPAKPFIRSLDDES